MYDDVGPCKFVFSSVVASVGNGGIRAVIFIRRLGCLTVEKPISITSLYTTFRLSTRRKTNLYNQSIYAIFIRRLGCVNGLKKIYIPHFYTGLGCLNVENAIYIRGFYKAFKPFKRTKSNLYAPF